MADAPDYIYSKGRSYNHGWCGPHGIIAGLREAMETGRPVTFLIADHHSTGDKIRDREVIAYAEDAFWYCGESDDYMGGGSHLLSDESIEHAAAALATELTRRLAVVEYNTGLTNLVIFRERKQCVGVDPNGCGRPVEHDGDCGPRRDPP